MKIVLHLVREHQKQIYEGGKDETYSDAISACGLVPDTVIIVREGNSIPQDEPLTEGEVDVLTTASRG
jgi:sulfur carrier protein ThiS